MCRKKLAALVLLILFWAPMATAEDSGLVTIRLTVDGEGKVTKIEITPLRAVVEKGQFIVWNVVVQPLESTASPTVHIVFERSPFHGGAPHTYSGNDRGFILSGEVNVEDGEFPYTVKAFNADGTVITRSLPTLPSEGAVVSVRNVPPRCGPQVGTIVDGKTAILIPVQDLESGLKSITPSTENATVTGHDSFAVGTNEEIKVLAVKQREGERSRVQLKVVDVGNNETSCDPILTEVIRSQGQPISETYTGILEEEHIISIFNGSPGLRNLEITVNESRFPIHPLRDGENLRVDVAEAMLPGDDNIIVLRATGKPGGQAVILIWNGR